MNKRTEMLSKKVSEAGAAVKDEIRQVTERVTARVDQMKKRLERFDDRRDSGTNLRAIRPGGNNR